MKTETSKATLGRNEIARVNGENTLAQIHSGDLVLTHNPIPYEVTEANKASIGEGFCGIANTNPAHDAAQKLYERKQAKIDHANFRDFLRSRAVTVSEKHIRQAKIPCAHLKWEFVNEVESAIGLALAVRVSRFPKLAQDLIARFACNALPDTTRRAFARIERRACDARLRRMSGQTALVSPSFFNVFTDDPDQSVELNAVFVKSRIDDLLARVREKGATNGNAARAAKSHERLLDAARVYFLASLAGSETNLPAHGFTRETYVAAFHRSIFFMVNESGSLSPSLATEAKEETGNEHLSGNALYRRIERLREFVGGF